MKKKILIKIQLMLLALFVQGCRADDVKEQESAAQVNKPVVATEADDEDRPSHEAAGLYVSVPVRMSNPIPGGLYPEVCEAFPKNIEVKDGKHVPVSCQVELDPLLKKDFDKPDWKDLDPAKNMQYVEMMVGYDTRFYVKVQGQKKMTEDERRAWYEREFNGRLEREKNRIGSGEFSGLQIAEIDYNNDGKVDFVIREKPPKVCRDIGTTKWIPRLYLLTPDKKTIDDQRMKPDFSRDVFFYKGQTFFYWANGSGSGLSISRPLNLSGINETYIQDVCIYKYKVN
jgi:hypothetical protein